MDDATRNRQVANARSLERAGDHEGAWRAYLKAESVDDAARILSALGRVREAAELLLREFSIDVKNAGALDDAGRRHARKAAVLLSQAEDWGRAGELYGSLGDLERAAHCYEKAGDTHTAERLRQRLHGRAPQARAVSSDVTATHQTSRVPSLQPMPVAAPLEVQTVEGRAKAAYLRGDFATAGRAFLDAGLPWEAAVSFSKGNDEARCFDALVSVDVANVRYRGACRHAIHLASRFDRLPDRLLVLVGSFVSALPETDDELAAMLVFAELEFRFGHRAHALARLEALESHYGDKPAVRLVASRVRANAGRDPQGQPFDAMSSVALPAPAKPESMLRASELIAAGTVLADRFRLEKRIGRGGFASVYRAYDLELDTPLAIKVLDSNDNEQGQASLKREVALARRLAHPNIVNVWDFVVHEGLFLIKMELLEGQMLRDRMLDPMQPDEAVNIIAQACEGLQFAHDHGIVHRDVKPDNLFVTSDGVVKLTDFGVARSFNDAPRNHASQPVLVSEPKGRASAQGSPHYMAPEHSSTFEHLAPAADQYALGVVTFELLTGRLPFHADTVPELLGLHALAPVPALVLEDAELGKRLERVVHRMLAKTVDARFATCRSAADALRAALR